MNCVYDVELGTLHFYNPLCYHHSKRKVYFFKILSSKPIKLSLTSNDCKYCEYQDLKQKFLLLYPLKSRLIIKY